VERPRQHDLILARRGVQGDDCGHPRGRIDPDGHRQPILQGVAIGGGGAVGLYQILEGGIKNLGERE
jgi:hypothetical protein